jgi:hypothetical protein
LLSPQSVRAKFTKKVDQTFFDFALDARHRDDEQHGDPDDQGAGNVILCHDNLPIAGETSVLFYLTLIYAAEFPGSSYLDWENIGTEPENT